MTDIKDKRGNDVIVAVHINRRHNRNVIQKIASLYSKSDNYGNNRIDQYVKNQIDSGNLIDASNKKAPNWFTSRGLQLPKLVQTIIDANIIIADSSENINTPGEKRMNQSRDDLFDDDDLFTEDTTAENIIARHYTTHAAEIGEVLRNTADIAIAPNTVKNIISRVIRENLGKVDERTKRELTVRLMAELESVKTADPETIVDNMIAVVRDVVQDMNVTVKTPEKLHNKCQIKGKCLFFREYEKNKTACKTFKNGFTMRFLAWS